MELGFETCGNATIIAYENGTPVVATDPWIEGEPYFGAWRLPYEISARQLGAIKGARYIWFSHGHPDHLNPDSLDHIRESTILVPQHVGRRILTDLEQRGFRTRELRSREWVQLSSRIRVLSIADWNQDGCLLVAFDNRCAVLNLNDGNAWANKQFLKRQLASFPIRFALRLVNNGDADLVNVFDETGQCTFAPQPALRLGERYGRLLKCWNATHTAPFSCFHAYNRSDTKWAAGFEAPLPAHQVGFDPAAGVFIPGYFAYDVVRDRVDLLPMTPIEQPLKDPAVYGDDWSQDLNRGDRAKIDRYFRRFEHLQTSLGFLRFRVGTTEHSLVFDRTDSRGISLQAPRNALMSAVEYEIFDDLLIGNFVKVTLHGGLKSLYPDFTPYVAKYGDNGRAHSATELRQYFRAYARAGGLEFWKDWLEFKGVARLRYLLSGNDHLYGAARRAYGWVRSRA